MNEPPLISTEALVVGYREPLLKEASISIHAGEMISVIGLNGSGKSTLLKTLSGQLAPLQGMVRSGDADLASIPIQERSRLLAMVTPAKAIAGQMDVRMMVALGRQPWTGYFGKHGPEDERHINDAMERTGIAMFVGRNIGELSDGERQKVMIARGLAQQTPVLLLDEPTAFLDLKNRVMVMDLLRDVAHSTGRGVLLSTHDLQLALDLSDRIFIVTTQGMIWMGTPANAIKEGVLEREFSDERITFDPSSRSFILK